LGGKSHSSGSQSPISRFDFRFAAMGTVVRIKELRGISNTPAPMLVGYKSEWGQAVSIKPSSNGSWLGKRNTIGCTKESGSWHKKDSLLPVTHFDVEPTFVTIPHVSRKICAPDLFVQ
jgi:hypothetical protein